MAWTKAARDAAALTRKAHAGNKPKQAKRGLQPVPGIKKESKKEWMARQKAALANSRK